MSDNEMNIGDTGRVVNIPNADVAQIAIKQADAVIAALEKEVAK